MRIAAPADRAAVLALYERCSYRGGLSDEDEVIVATSEEEMVAAVRLCSEGGEVVLRGMQVHPERRRRGIGSLLLDACAAALGDRACFCLPYDHLLDFYGRIGFRRVEKRELPLFLQERYRRYLDSGVSVIAMLRQPASSDS